MFKMGLHDPFGYLKHKLWLKEWPEIKFPIWLPTIKSQESPWFTCVQVACHILLESSRRKLQLCFRLHFNRRYAQEVMGLQISESPNLGNFGTLNLRVPRQNDISVLALWPSTKNTIKGKMMISPKFGSWWVLCVCVCSCLVCAPKMFQLCTNQLVVWFV